MVAKLQQSNVNWCYLFGKSHHFLVKGPRAAGCSNEVTGDEPSGGGTLGADFEILMGRYLLTSLRFTFLYGNFIL